MSAGIFGIGAALPDHVIANDWFVDRLETSDEWIVKRTGIRERRWLNGKQTLADLAAQACSKALADAGREPSEVDHVICATITADMITPGLAPDVAARIGATRAGAVDLNAACAGFLYGLDQAAALIESRRADVVLVCGAEALSRLTDVEDRGTAVLFGDGAGAVVVARGELEMGLPPFELRCDGVNLGAIYARTDERLLRMQGRVVYRHAVARMVEATRNVLDRAGMRVDEVDLFVGHQANARILTAAAEELGIAQDRVVLDVDQHANTSAASIPLALARAEEDGRLRPGARVALAAFGAGFVWGAGIVSWKERVHVCA